MMSNNLVLFLFYLFLDITYSEVPIVDTTHGKLSGKVLKTLIKEVEYYGFMGIPYAVPPLKDLRFLPPQSIEPWQDILPATKEKRPCMQYNNNVKKGQPLGYYGAEDCLYLDIFTPALFNKRPILVFLYNEHFRYSYNKTKDYAPDFFIEEDVIIATVSHRLSAFGFLSFEDDTLPGNAGLSDIVVALEWLKTNAERFGGDPDRITLLGAQGGATAVDLLIHSKARRLFNSVILQSGSAWTSMYLADKARERAFKLGDILKRGSSNSDRLLKELNDVPVKDLLEREFEAVHKDYTKLTQRGLHPFGPIVEKRTNGLITEYPEHVENVDVPMLIGFNSREGLEPAFQYLIEPKYLSFVQKDFVLLMPRRLKFRFDPLDDSYEKALNAIKRFYFPKEKVTIRNVPEYVTYIGDVMTEAIDYMVNFYSNISSKEIYYYHFDYYSDLNENKNDILRLSTVEDGTWGAATGDELCYLFKCPRLKWKYLKHSKAKSEEIMMQRKLVRMWANFSKYGNPTPAGDALLDGLHWPTFNSETKEYLHIDRKIEAKRDLLSDRFRFWEDFIRKWEKKAVNGVIGMKHDEL